jgi:hypothetical protein
MRARNSATDRTPLEASAASTLEAPAATAIVNASSGPPPAAPPPFSISGPSLRRAIEYFPQHNTSEVLCMLQHSHRYNIEGPMESGN